MTEAEPEQRPDLVADFRARNAREARAEHDQAVAENRLAHQNPDPALEDDPIRRQLAARRLRKRTIRRGPWRDTA